MILKILFKNQPKTQAQWEKMLETNYVELNPAHHIIQFQINNDLVMTHTECSTLFELRNL